MVSIIKMKINICVAMWRYSDLYGPAYIYTFDLFWGPRCWFTC